MLTATNGVDDFDLIAVVQGGVDMLATGQDILIELHRQAAARQLKAADQIGYGLALRQRIGLTVQLYLHGSGIIHDSYFTPLGWQTARLRLPSGRL